MNINATIACSHMPDPAQLLQAAMVSVPDLSTVDFERYLLAARALSAIGAGASARHRRHLASARALVVDHADASTVPAPWSGFRQAEAARQLGVAFDARA